MFGNDGGVYRTANGISSSPSFQNKNIGYNVTQFYKGAISQSGTEKLLAGAQDNGSQLIVNTPGIGSSTEVFGGDGCWEFIDKQNEFMVTSYVYNSYHFVQYATNTATTYIANNTTDGDFVNQCGLWSYQWTSDS